MRRGGRGVLQNSDGASWQAVGDSTAGRQNQLTQNGSRYAVVGPEKAGNVVKCRSPSDQRCLSYDPVTYGDVCGKEYTGERCNLCQTPGFYQDSDLSCKSCPTDSFLEFIRSAAPFVCSLISVLVIIFFIGMNFCVDNCTEFFT